MHCIKNIDLGLSKKDSFGKKASKEGFRVESIIASILSGRCPPHMDKDTAQKYRITICQCLKINPDEIEKATCRKQELSKNGKKDSKTKTDVLVVLKGKEKSNSKKILSLTIKNSTKLYVGGLETTMPSLAKTELLSEEVLSALNVYADNGYKIRSLSKDEKQTISDFFSKESNRKSFSKHVIVGENNNELQKPTHVVFYNKKDNNMFIASVDEYIELSMVTRYNDKPFGSFKSGLNFTRTSGEYQNLKIREINPLGFYNRLISSSPNNLKVINIP